MQWSPRNRSGEDDDEDETGEELEEEDREELLEDGRLEAGSDGERWNGCGRRRHQPLDDVSSSDDGGSKCDADDDVDSDVIVDDGKISLRWEQ